MRILHVLNLTDKGGTDAAAWLCAATIADSPRHSHRVLLLGTAAAEQRVAVLGLRVHGRVCPPRLGPWPAANPIMAVLRSWNRGTAFQRIQMWDCLATMCRTIARWSATSVCFVDTRTGRIEEVGKSEGMLPAVVSHVPPSIGTRAEVRRRLGIALDERVVLGLGHSPHDTDAHLLAEVVGILNVAGVTATALTPKGSRFETRAIRHAREGYLKRLVVSDEPMPALLAAADVALHVPVNAELTFARGLFESVASAAGVATVRPAGADEARSSTLATRCLKVLESGAAPAGSGEAANAPAKIIEFWNAHEDVGEAVTA
ncbi:MAG: hypothetical protein JSR77_15825 [Planctomycetes bacterium]|nr:hypothetical protein [Planctomycetota bacterium]